MKLTHWGPKYTLSEGLAETIEFLRKNERITNKQGRELTGIKSENAMKKVFYSLRDEGIIEMIPKGAKTEWVLIRN